MVRTKQVHTLQLTTPNNKIAATDAQIDRLVHKLYRLTEDSLPLSGCVAISMIVEMEIRNGKETLL